MSLVSDIYAPFNFGYFQIRLDNLVSAAEIPDHATNSAAHSLKDVAIELETSTPTCIPHPVKKFSAPVSFYAQPQKGSVKGPR